MSKVKSDAVRTIREFISMRCHLLQQPNATEIMATIMNYTHGNGEEEKNYFMSIIAYLWFGTMVHELGKPANKLRRQIFKMITHRNSLESELSCIKNENVKLKTDNVSLKTDNISLEKRYNKLKKENESLSMEKQEYETRSKTMIGTIQKDQDTIEDHEAEIAKLRDEAKKLQNELTEMKAKYKAKKKECRFLQTTVNHDAKDNDDEKEAGTLLPPELEEQYQSKIKSGFDIDPARISYVVDDVLKKCIINLIDHQHGQINPKLDDLLQELKSKTILVRAFGICQLCLNGTNGHDGRGCTNTSCCNGYKEKLFELKKIRNDIIHHAPNASQHKFDHVKDLISDVMAGMSALALKSDPN